MHTPPARLLLPVVPHTLRISDTGQRRRCGEIVEIIA